MVEAPFFAPEFGTFLSLCFGILSPGFALGHGISFLAPSGFGISEIDHSEFHDPDLSDRDPYILI